MATNPTTISGSANTAAPRQLAALALLFQRLPLDYRPHSGRSAWKRNCFQTNSGTPDYRCCVVLVTSAVALISLEWVPVGNRGDNLPISATICPQRTSPHIPGMCLACLRPFRFRTSVPCPRRSGWCDPGRGRIVMQSNVFLAYELRVNSRTAFSHIDCNSISCFT